MSLNDPRLKMSKSHQDARSRININDDQEVIRNKIRLALTDSINGISYDPVDRPGVSNLLTIMSYLDNDHRTPEELATHSQEMSMRHFKDQVSRTIYERLTCTRERYSFYIQADKASYLDRVIAEGSLKARRQADRILKTVRDKLGFS